VVVMGRRDIQMSFKLALTVVKRILGGAGGGYMRIGLAAVVAIALTVGVFKVNKIASRANLSYTLESELETSIAEVKQIKLYSERREQKLIEASESLTCDISKIKERKVIQIKEVIRYVKDDSNCNLSVGAVGMLNSAIEGGMQEATELSIAERYTTSDINQRAEVKAHLACINQYSELLARHDALIDWVSEDEK